MILTRWICPYCKGLLDLTIVDTNRDFICAHCSERVSIEDEGEDPTELKQNKEQRIKGRQRTMLFVATLFSGLMGVVLTGQVNEILADSAKLDSMSHGALCGGVGAIVAALVLAFFRKNSQSSRAAMFLAFGTVAAMNLIIFRQKGMPEGILLITQLWAISGFWLVTGSAMLLFGAKRPDVLETAPKAKDA
ncbi:MAG: hypothetical protein V3V10_10250 [Planctomycetota bacterium]